MRLARLLAAAVLCVAAPVAAWRAPDAPAADERLERVRERRRQLERELARIRVEEKSLLGEVERLDVEVRLRGEQLRELQLLLQRTAQEIDAASKRAQALERSLDAARPSLQARARALYKLGDVSYLRLLLSVDRPADFLNGYRFVSALARRDNQRFAGFRADLGALEAARAELTRRTQETLRLRAEADRARRALEADRQRKTALLTELVERKETNAAFVAELQQAEERLQALLSGLETDAPALPAAAFKGDLPWPAEGRLRSGFGRRKHPRFDTYTLQNGIEIAAPLDAPVFAVADGSVVFADRFRGYGLLVVIDHGGKLHTLYAHLAATEVEPGQRAMAGQAIGSVGSGVEGPALYFEVRNEGRAEDPLDWLRRPAER